MVFTASAAPWRPGAVCIGYLLHDFAMLVRASDGDRSGSVTVAGACSAVRPVLPGYIGRIPHTSSNKQLQARGQRDPGWCTSLDMAKRSTTWR